MGHVWQRQAILSCLYENGEYRYSNCVAVSDQHSAIILYNQNSILVNDGRILDSFGSVMGHLDMSENTTKQTLILTDLSFCSYIKYMEEETIAWISLLALFLIPLASIAPRMLRKIMKNSKKNARIHQSIISGKK